MVYYIIIDLMFCIYTVDTFLTRIKVFKEEELSFDPSNENEDKIKRKSSHLIDL